MASPSPNAECQVDDASIDRLCNLFQSLLTERAAQSYSCPRDVFVGFFCTTDGKDGTIDESAVKAYFDEYVKAHFEHGESVFAVGSKTALDGFRRDCNRALYERVFCNAGLWSLTGVYEKLPGCRKFVGSWGFYVVLVLGIVILILIAATVTASQIRAHHVEAIVKPGDFITV